MELVTRLLKNEEGPVSRPDGSPVANAVLNFRLVDASTLQPVSLLDAVSGQVVVSELRTAKIDAAGMFSIYLWPNGRGEKPTVYEVSSTAGIDPFYIKLSDSAAAISLVEAKAAFEDLAPQDMTLFEAVLANINGSRDQAEAAASSASSSAAEAAASSESAQDSEAAAIAAAGESAASRDQAASSASAAEDSQAAAELAAGNSQAAAVAAAGCRDQAAGSAAAAAGSAAAAEAAAIATRDTATYRDQAAGSAAAAQGSADAAAGSAIAAAASAATSQGSANASAGSATAAAASATAAANALLLLTVPQRVANGEIVQILGAMVNGVFDAATQAAIANKQAAGWPLTSIIIRIP